MVSDASQIQRSVDLDLITERVFDRLALKIFVGVSRTGNAIAETKRRGTNWYERGSRQSMRLRSGFPWATACDPNPSSDVQQQITTVVRVMSMLPTDSALEEA